MMRSKLYPFIGVASNDVQITIGLVGKVVRSKVGKGRLSDFIDFGLDRLSTNLLILFGELTVSDSMISASW